MRLENGGLSPQTAILFPQSSLMIPMTLSRSLFSKTDHIPAMLSKNSLQMSLIQLCCI